MNCAARPLRRRYVALSVCSSPSGILDQSPVVAGASARIGDCDRRVAASRSSQRPSATRRSPSIYSSAAAADRTAGSRLRQRVGGSLDDRGAAANHVSMRPGERRRAARPGTLEGAANFHLLETLTAGAGTNGIRTIGTFAHDSGAGRDLAVKALARSRCSGASMAHVGERRASTVASPCGGPIQRASRTSPRPVARTPRPWVPGSTRTGVRRSPQLARAPDRCGVRACALVKGDGTGRSRGRLSRQRSGRVSRSFRSARDDRLRCRVLRRHDPRERDRNYRGDAVTTRRAAGCSWSGTIRTPADRRQRGAAHVPTVPRRHRGRVEERCGRTRPALVDRRHRTTSAIALSGVPSAAPSRCRRSA